MNYPSIRIEGSILSPDIIDRLEDMPGQRPTDFGLDSGTKVKDEIVRAWADAQDYWRIFQRKMESVKPDTSAATETRNNWIVPLLSLLKYDIEFQKQGAELNGKIYAISHRVVNRGQTPLHIVGYRDPAGLDRKPANATLRMSAHAIVQEYLNLTEQLYGIVTNGHVIRLLRDSSRLIKQSYLEFDLDRIFTDGLFADFAILYRILHATRLPQSAESASESLIEKLHQDSLDSGARIRSGLSKAVEKAILDFGNGFISHPDNVRLRERLETGEITPKEYYASLLRLIYRLLFLMVIEERGLVFPPNASQRHRDLYYNYYSIQRLRNLSEKRYLADKRQSDLWLAMRSTFQLFEADGPGEMIGLKPLAGDLFGPNAIGELGGSQLSNESLLTCLRSLGLYQHPQNKQLIRVNYAALNVEEFGSVYEGLLEYEPEIDHSGAVPVFRFKQGDERSATGSHYTPDDLVQPLIKHSLDHLIADRIKKPNPEQELLDLRVADIACGSGHILLAAARRIATELAIVRTGEEQPSPTAYREALRDAIRHCIYGVDLNPLAVELCKVALWLEAHNPGEPLNFLDHRIKCGNAIVGFVKREEVDNGIPDEAFAKLPGDDPEVAKRLRAKNKGQRKERLAKSMRVPFTPSRTNQIDYVQQQWSALNALPEDTPAEIDAKKRAYEEFSGSDAAMLLKHLASMPVAQFYLPRLPENESKIVTDEQFTDYWSGNRIPDERALEATVGVESTKRFFHWFLEFPEIIQRGGFDCILGNPPYLGDKALSGTYGHEFCNYLKFGFAPTGISDLVVYFLRRSFALIRRAGFLAFITTNSIKDGDVRKDGLERVLAEGGTLCMAIGSTKWPGRAKLFVSVLSIHREASQIPNVLDGKSVTHINAFLEEGESEQPPRPLSEAAGVASTGTYFLGDGFLLSHEEAGHIRGRNPATEAVLSPLINAKELNNSPCISPGRVIIDFGDRTEAEAAAFPEPFRVVVERVKPERERQSDNTARDKWWLFMRARREAYARTTRLTHCFVAARTTKHLAVVACPTNWVYSDATNFFTNDRWDFFAVMQGGIHEAWARKYSGYLATILRYSPSDCFETFAFPEDLWQTPNALLADIGERYHEHRRKLMPLLWLGLTDTYNLFHSPSLADDLTKHYARRAKQDPHGLKIPGEHREAALAFTIDEAIAGINELRRLHVELDIAVRDAYGWQDLPLDHDFYEVETLPENDRVRYTISPAARKELLKRLLELNHKRAAEEAAAMPVKKGKGKKGDSIPIKANVQTLFDD
jgi:hypothetical protein